VAPGQKRGAIGQLMDDSKRTFLKDGILEIARLTVRAFREGMRQAAQRERYEQFFRSYESSYPLTLGYPDDILLETAKRAGVKIEGREKRDIVRELLEKTGGY
jgi:hypothetical protein